ncbi:lysine-rich nucleolar protein 1 isoform X2 [Echinops telfairi]|nr:lysine-rich nucleolar protein 1 isoform X2 [Echinops telfairi]XP_045141926.1 lysine-rich nucleolar protein 1 isoform X2 [Echinops telfairi]
MITKTQRVDVGVGLPEKKKKKKVVKEPELQYSVFKDDYFIEVSPHRTTSRSKSAFHTPETPLVKKKKKKKKVPALDHLEPQAVLLARRPARSASPRKQALSVVELHSGEEKKKKQQRRSVSVLGLPHGLAGEPSLHDRLGVDGPRAGKKLKKHKKEKSAQDPVAFSAQSPWLYEAGDVLYTCAARELEEELAAAKQKRKQGSRIKVKKKKKIYQDGDLPLEHLEISGLARSSSRKRSKKKLAEVEVLDYIPIGEDSKAPVKKKCKSKKQAEPGAEELMLKRKKKKQRKERRDTGAHGDQEADPDLEVVLEKKGNMDETHIDQMRRRALQEEIDRESGKTEVSETKKGKGTKFGQWDTAGFENEDRKLKFLRLIGGFKNLSPPPSSRPSSTASKPNMALGKEAANGLRLSLQQDYERAKSRQHSRRAGLGFSHAPNKVFYIDRTASKSIKFED